MQLFKKSPQQKERERQNTIKKLLKEKKIRLIKFTYMGIEQEPLVMPARSI